MDFSIPNKLAISEEKIDSLRDGRRDSALRLKMKTRVYI